jgi:phosphatidylserine decarboxylase
MRRQTLLEARWIFAVLLLFSILSFLFFKWVLVLWVGLIGFTLYFFRDPERLVPPDPAAVVAAADGVVVDVVEMIEPEVLKVPMTRIAIFLSVVDVHTNRAPIDGKITYSELHHGQFLDARHPDATNMNECRTWAFKGTTTVVVRQITGAIARRIVAWSKPGETVSKGERFGMIRFGSRTEIYVPIDSVITVQAGDRVLGGASIVARLAESDLQPEPEAGV